MEYHDIDPALWRQTVVLPEYERSDADATLRAVLLAWNPAPAPVTERLAVRNCRDWL